MLPARNRWDYDDIPEGARNQLDSSGSIALRKAIAGALQPGMEEALLSPTAAPAVA